MEAIIKALATRTTEQLKKDCIVAMNSIEEGSALVFKACLDILEERLSVEEYQSFEDSL